MIIPYRIFKWKEITVSLDRDMLKTVLRMNHWPEELLGYVEVYEARSDGQSSARTSIVAHKLEKDRSYSLEIKPLPFTWKQENASAFEDSTIERAIELTGLPTKYFDPDHFFITLTRESGHLEIGAHVVKGRQYYLRPC